MHASASVLLLLASAPSALAAVNDTYLAGLAQALSGAGLTQLASAAASINTTSEGQALLSALPNGKYTVFAPNNDAFSALSSDIASNATLLASILSYHVVPGNLTNASATYPNVTVARTLLNDSSLVALEGNKSQVVAWTTESGNTTVLNQATNITLQSHTTYQNLDLLTITSVLAPPANLSTTLSTFNLTGVQGVIASVPGLADVLAAAHGYTLFAPDDAAVQAAQTSLGSVESNQTLLLTVLRNHVINGTSAYSPLLLATNYTTAAGEPLSVHTNASGTYVTSGTAGASAKIVRSDVLVQNGVVHVVDGVLVDLGEDEGAASSAYASATSAAAQSATQTGPITASAPAPSSSGSGKKNGARSVAGGAGVCSVVAVAVLGALVVFV